MTHVDIASRLIQPAGHHRQPRSSTTWTALPGGSSFESPAGSFVNATSSVVPDAQFVFWSASDGSGGQTTPSTSVHQQVGSTALAVTAWYLPVGGGVGPGQSGYLLDAFSVAHGDFIDDTFVDVTSRATASTLQRRIFTIPGRLVRSARRLHLRLPERWPWSGPFDTALAAITALPMRC